MRRSTPMFLLIAALAVARPVRAADKPTQNIIETLTADGRFKTLVKAFGDADLAKLLEGKSPHTVFAPTDAVLALLPEGLLAAMKDPSTRKPVLLGRIVTGKHLAKELSGRKSIKSLTGREMRLDATDGLKVDDARVTQGDLEATNGVIHVIDVAGSPSTAKPADGGSFHGLSATTLEGTTLLLSEFKGKVTLIVNVASACGFTLQYTGLQKLHAEFAERGFSVLGFPSNEFGGQEPGDAGDIRKFCDTRYHVKFPLFEKLVTKPGGDQSPIYAFLTKGHPAPNWNFCKYLVGKDGKVIAFYASQVTPDDADLRQAIEAALK